MKKGTFLLLVLLVAFSGTAGCSKIHKSFQVRNPNRVPIPRGKIAILPVICGPEVRHVALARIMARRTIRALGERDVEVLYEDLDGSFFPIPTDPAEKEKHVKRSLSLLRSKGFKACCALTMLRYGYYPSYVPPQVVALPHNSYTSGHASAYGTYGSAHATGESYTRGYRTGVVPGHWSSAAVVSGEFSVMDVQKEKISLYLFGTTSSRSKEVEKVERAFIEELAERFEEAMEKQPKD